MVGPHSPLHQDVRLLFPLAKVPLLPVRVVALQQAGAPPQLIGSGGDPLSRQQGGACHHHILEPAERQGHQVVGDQLHGPQSDVILPLAHVDHGIGEVELDLDTGAELGKTGEQLAHHAVPRTDRAGEAQAAAVLLGQGADPLLRLPGQGEDLAGLLVKHPPRLGQAESAGRALEQLGIEGGLQGADMATQHPLAHPQGIGSGGETAPLHHFIETGQVSDIHH